jgi:hypothetical protein
VNNSQNSTGNDTKNSKNNNKGDDKSTRDNSNVIKLKIKENNVNNNNNNINIDGIKRSPSDNSKDMVKLLTRPDDLVSNKRNSCEKETKKDSSHDISEFMQKKMEQKK